MLVLNLTGPGLLLSPEDCALVDRHELAAIHYGYAARKVPPPAALLELASAIHQIAEAFRANAQANPRVGNGNAPHGGRVPLSGQEDQTVLLTVREAAACLSVSETTVKNLLRQSALAGVKSGQGGAWEIDGACVQAYLAAREQRHRKGA
jgi:excisionase family DNA binding protein